jgi:hypothetical protein
VLRPIDSLHSLFVSKSFSHKEAQKAQEILLILKLLVIPGG